MCLVKIRIELKLRKNFAYQNSSLVRNQPWLITYKVYSKQKERPDAERKIHRRRNNS